MDAQAEIDQIKADRKRIGGRMTNAEKARIAELEKELDAPSANNAALEGAEVTAAPEPEEDAPEAPEAAPETPETPEGYSIGVVFAPNLTLPDGSKAKQGDLVTVPDEFLLAMTERGLMGDEGEAPPRPELKLDEPGELPDAGEGEVVARILSANLTLPDGTNRPRNSAVVVDQAFFDAMVEMGRLEAV